MATQLTTSVSNALLTYSVLYFIYNVFWVNVLTCLGLAIQGLAAFLGVLRFAQSRPKIQVCEYHSMIAWLSQVVGIPMLAVGFCHKNMPTLMNLNLIVIVAILISNKFLAAGPRQLATEVSVGFGLLTIIIVSARTWNVYAFLASAAYIASLKFIGSEGKMGLFLRLDLLHLGLAVGNVLFAWGLANQ